MEQEILVSLVAILTFVWGAAASYIQERFGRYEDLAPNIKQLINAIVVIVVPVIAGFVQPWWRPDFGDLNGVLTAVLLFLSPVLAWLFSQVAHQVDLWFKDQHKA